MTCLFQIFGVDGLFGPVDVLIVEILIDLTLIN